MRFIVGRYILSHCFNTVRNAVPGGVSIRDVKFHSYYTKWAARAISTDQKETESELAVRENNVDPMDVSGSTDSKSEVISGVNNVPAFVKLNDNDSMISKAMLSVKTKKNLKKGNEILLEGGRLISDAIKFGAVPKVVFFSRLEDVAEIRWPSGNFQLYKVSYRSLQHWSSLTTSPGVIAIFKKPDTKVKEGDKRTMPLIIVCDNIRDPGNLGSILRVAAGVGCKHVLLTKGCVELWEPKVLRSGAGAHFVLPVQSECTWDIISSNYLDEYSTIVLADNSSSEVDFKNHPLFTRYRIPLEKYLNVDYSGAWDDESDVVLILGGETAGLSPEACELANERGGVRLNIPLSYDIESLNASTALGIIAFEIRRQYDEWLRRTDSLSSEKVSEL